ncbi:MAG TPA: protein-export chaperone SecB [Hyphomicrobiales bacterium]|nr:protein-export chaperone SecB [Hyphomicrobiales bacterium]
MSEETNGAAAPEDQKDKRPQINVLGQYIKDLSFENPGAPASLRPQEKQPGLQMNFNVQAKAISEDVYEVLLALEANAKIEDESLYTLELVYGGAFRLKDLPEQAIRPFLFVECPALLFPYARRLIADLTREGGFAPLALDPIDFASLYRQRLAEEQKSAEAPAPSIQ